MSLESEGVFLQGAFLQAGGSNCQVWSKFVSSLALLTVKSISLLLLASVLDSQEIHSASWPVTVCIYSREWPWFWLAWVLSFPGTQSKLHLGPLWVPQAALTWHPILSSLKPLESVSVPAMIHGIEQRIETSQAIKNFIYLKKKIKEQAHLELLLCMKPSSPFTDEETETHQG